MRTADPQIPAAAIEQAVAWYVRLASGTTTAQDRSDFGRWRDAHPDHALAWKRLQDMGARVQGSASRVAPSVTHATMTRLASASGRRQVLKTLAWIGAAGTGLYLVQDPLPWRNPLAAALADLSTAAGERRSMVLVDGTQLRLNTATAVDLRFDARQRRIVLRSGEIMIATATDPAGRPLIVETADGTLLPIGTRFTVRHDRQTGGHRYTQLAVAEGEVEVLAAGRRGEPAALIRSGQQVRFSRDRIEAATPLDEAGQAWVDGTFAAERMRLEDFLAELSRYRPGRLRCMPEVADLRITGAWPLNGPDATERVLESLERRLPVRVQRYTRYWITVAAR